jgi:hypothetical protein
MFDGGQPGCTPNNDGTVTRAEAPFGPGLRATYSIAADVTFNTAANTADGGRTWDFTPMLAGQRSELIETQPIAGQWFANDFAGAGWAAPLAGDSTLLGVFEATPDSILLRGIVSPTKNSTYTKMTFSPAVKVLVFPLTPGKTWSTATQVSGINLGVAAYWTESYDSVADVSGTSLTPYATFPVLRVRTSLLRNVGGFFTSSRTHLHVAECFGTVASVTSKSGETGNEFSNAAEVKRLAP